MLIPAVANLFHSTYDSVCKLFLQYMICPPKEGT